MLLPAYIIPFYCVFDPVSDPAPRGMAGANLNAPSAIRRRACPNDVNPPCPVRGLQLRDRLVNGFFATPV